MTTSVKRMTGLEVNVAVHELRQLVYLRVMNVYSINKRTYLIKLGGTNPHYSVTTKKYLIIESGTRMHLTDYDHGVSSVQNALASSIRRHLKGKLLTAADQIGLDRVVRLQFGVGETAWNLFVELFGTGNIILADADFEIKALLKQQNYSNSLLGLKQSSDTPDGVPTTTTSTSEQIVTLGSRYQWNPQQLDLLDPSNSLPSHVTCERVCELFANKHQRVLDQDKLSQEQQRQALDATDSRTAAEDLANNNAKRKRSQKEKKISVKAVLYESIFGAQLSLHGCSVSHIDISVPYTTVLTDNAYAESLTAALNVGLKYFSQQVLPESIGYLLSTQHTTTIRLIQDSTNDVIEEKTQINYSTQDYSPGNFEQLSMSPYIMHFPQIPSLTAPKQRLAVQLSADSTTSPPPVMAADLQASDAALYLTCEATQNKPQDSWIPTYILPETGGCTAFPWQVVPSTAPECITEHINAKQLHKRRSGASSSTAISIDSLLQQLPPTISGDLTIEKITTTRQAWFYCPVFSSSVDEYFGLKAVEREEQRVERELINARTRVDKAKKEQDDKLQTMQESIDHLILQAQLIEDTSTFVNGTLGAITKLLDDRRPHHEIEALLQSQRLQLNVLALIVKKIDFASRCVDVSLTFDLQHVLLFMQQQQALQLQQRQQQEAQHAIVNPDVNKAPQNQNQPKPQDDQQGDVGDDDDDDDDDGDDDEVNDKENTIDEDEDDDDVVVLDDTTEDAAQQEAQDRAPGGAKNPVTVRLQLDQSALKNAARIYAQSKEMRRKMKVAQAHANETLKTIEAKANKEIHEVKEVQAKVRRKTQWFEKFHWFLTSDGFLVVGGRDSTQNEVLVKRYLEPYDLYFHADLHGSSSVILKVPKQFYPPEQQGVAQPSSHMVPLRTITQAAAFATCYSHAWANKTVNFEAYWVFAHQVSKTPPTGTYLEKGSFMIRGTKNFVSAQPLVMGMGLLFVAGDQETKQRHLADHDQNHILAALSQVNGLNAEFDEIIETPDLEQDNTQQSSQQSPEQQEDEADAAATLIIPREPVHENDQDEPVQENDQDDSNKPIAAVQDDDDVVEPTTPITTAPANKKRVLSKHDRYLMKLHKITDIDAFWVWKESQRANTTKPELNDGDDASDDDDDDDDDENNVSVVVTKPTKASQDSDDEIDAHTADMLQKLAALEANRGKKLQLVSSSDGDPTPDTNAHHRPNKRAGKGKKWKQEQRALEEEKRQRAEQKRLEDAKERRAQRQQLTVNSDDEDGYALENDEAYQRKQQQHQQELDSTGGVLISLITKPQPEDYLPYSIPVVAPWDALGDYMFKAKLVPGGGKKGATIHDAVFTFKQTIPQPSIAHTKKKAAATAAKMASMDDLMKKSTKSNTKAKTSTDTPDEVSEAEERLNNQQKQQQLAFYQGLLRLINQISDQEFSLAMISNARVAATGVQKIHQQQKQQKKQAAKNRDGK